MMATVTRYQGKKYTFEQVLEAARSLPLIEQRRLRDELAKEEQVYFVRPGTSDEAVRRGQKLADEVRSEVKEVDETLDQAMSKLRGRKWS
jgi:hypothetical protein